MPRATRLSVSNAASPARGRAIGVAALVGAALFNIGAVDLPTAHAKSPGSRYCFNGFCHRVGTLAQTETLVGWRGYLLASYYDSCRLDRLNPCGLTSSGAVFRPDLPDNAASPLLPDGTVILAYNPKTGDSSVLRITNAGPYSGKRKLDVSRAAAEKLGFRHEGVAALVVSVLQSPTWDEASYVRRRVYASVPGYIGCFETFDIALKAARERFDGRDGRVEQIVDKPDFLAGADSLVPKPQLAVSPTLARELVMLRLAPQPARREPRLVEGPRLVSREDFDALRASSATGEPINFASGLRRYLTELSVPLGAD